MRIMGMLLVGVVAVAGASVWPAGAPAQAPAPAPAPAPKRAVVHLTEATSDLHAVVMAFKLASAMASCTTGS